MKYWLVYTLSVMLAGALFTLLYLFFVSPDHRATYTSPLPDFLTLGKNKQVTLLDLWSPLFETYASTGQKPVIGAKAALMYDLTQNKVLFEKNARERLPMASLTKIMTAIIALEDATMPEVYTVREEDLVGEDSMGLEPGEILTKEELLYGLMLNSGNDAAEVLARNYPTGRIGFLSAMHDKAKALGLQDTRFSNPSGLQGDGDQYTTAYDILIETRYAIESFPLFRQIVSTVEYTIPKSSKHKEYYLSNETNLLTTYSGVKGVKTGYTPEAGMCLVTYYEDGDTKLIGIVLNSPDRRGEMRELLDFSMKFL